MHYNILVTTRVFIEFVSFFFSGAEDSLLKTARGWGIRGKVQTAEDDWQGKLCESETCQTHANWTRCMCVCVCVFYLCVNSSGLRETEIFVLQIFRCLKKICLKVVMILQYVITKNWKYNFANAQQIILGTAQEAKQTLSKLTVVPGMSTRGVSCASFPGESLSTRWDLFFNMLCSLFTPRWPLRSSTRLNSTQEAYKRYYSRKFGLNERLRNLIVHQWEEERCFFGVLMFFVFACGNYQSLGLASGLVCMHSVNYTG